MVETYIISSFRTVDFKGYIVFELLWTSEEGRVSLYVVGGRRGGGGCVHMKRMVWSK